MDNTRKRTPPLSVGDVVVKVDSSGKKKPTHPWRCHVERPKDQHDKSRIPHHAMMGIKV